MLHRIVSSSSCTPWQWLPRHHDLLQDRQLYVQWHCVTSQKNWIISILHLYCLLCAQTIEAQCSSKSCYCNHLPTYGSHIPEVHSVCVHCRINLKAFFTHVSSIHFSFNVPYQFTPLLNLRFPIFGLTLFYFHLFLFFIYEYHLWFTLFWFMTTFSGEPGCKTRSCIWYDFAMS